MLGTSPFFGCNLCDEQFQVLHQLAHHRRVGHNGLETSWAGERGTEEVVVDASKGDQVELAPAGEASKVPEIVPPIANIQKPTSTAPQVQSAQASPIKASSPKKRNKPKYQSFDALGAPTPAQTPASAQSVVTSPPKNKPSPDSIGKASRVHETVPSTRETQEPPAPDRQSTPVDPPQPSSSKKRKKQKVRSAAVPPLTPGNVESSLTGNAQTLGPAGVDGHAQETIRQNKAATATPVDPLPQPVPVPVQPQQVPTRKRKRGKDKVLSPATVHSPSPEPADWLLSIGRSSTDSTASVADISGTTTVLLDQVQTQPPIGVSARGGSVAHAGSAPDGKGKGAGPTREGRHTHGETPPIGAGKDSTPHQPVPVNTEEATTPKRRKKHKDRSAANLSSTTTIPATATHTPLTIRQTSKRPVVSDGDIADASAFLDMVQRRLHAHPDSFAQILELLTTPAKLQDVEGVSSESICHVENLLISRLKCV